MQSIIDSCQPPLSIIMYYVPKGKWVFAPGLGGQKAHHEPGPTERLLSHIIARLGDILTTSLGTTLSTNICYAKPLPMFRCVLVWMYLKRVVNLTKLRVRPHTSLLSKQLRR